MDEDKVENIIDERLRLNNGALLKDMEALIRNQISGNKISSVKETPKFKRKSNEEQFKQNEKVISKLQEAETSLESGNITVVKESIIEAVDLLKHRQKLIQLADTSDLGWKVVSEYEQNPIADNSEDEKRIYKAEARASRKARAEKSKRGRGRYHPFRRSLESPGAQSTTPRSQIGQYGQRQRPGLCFLCGKAGHWKAECSLNTSSTNNKISSLYLDTIVKDETCKVPEVPKTFLEMKNTENVHVSIDKKTQLDITEKKKSKMEQKVNEVLSPVGRLRNQAKVWRKHTDNEYIVNVIENGYKLPFKTMPSKIQLKNNKTARDNSTFVKQEIQNLLEKGIVREVREKPYIVNPLTVAYNKIGKPRLVLDCRHINPHLHLFKIKFEDIKLAEQIFDCDSYVFTFDLKSAYHHIDIFEQHKTYLGFSWTENGIEKFYVYNSLPFGIAVAGHIFTKVLRVVLKYWRSQGHRVIMFLDDGIGGDADYTHAQQRSKIVREGLLDFGFLLADERCNWIPSQSAFWLGHYINFERNRIFISDERISRLEKAIKSVLFQIEKDKCNCIHVKCLASVVGMIISLQSVLGKVVCRMTKYLYKCIINRASWNAPVKVSLEAMKELYYWQDNTKHLNAKGKGLHEKETVDMFFYSDASSVGYGGYLAIYEQKEQVKRSKPIELQSTKNTKVVSAADKTNFLPEERICITEISKLNEMVKFYNTASDTYNLEVSENEFENFEIFHHGMGNRLTENTGLPEMNYISKMHAHRGIYENNRYVETDLPEVSCSAEVAGTEYTGSRLPEVSYSIVEKCNESRLPEVSYRDQTIIKVNENMIKRLPEVSNTLTGKSNINKCYLPKDGSSLVVLAEMHLISGSEVHGNWTALEASRSSTWRELEAVRRVLLSNTATINNKIIKVFTDNKNVTYILQTGSTIPDLHVLCLEIHDFCITNNIEIKVDWLPRKLNEKADHLSRCIDVDDWSISKQVFTYLDKNWGPHTIDRFASHYNNHCIRFNSRYWVPNTEGINALELDWSGETNWMVPPPKLILDCLTKIEKERCNGTIVIPEWPSAAFWPCLQNSDGTYRKFIADVYTLPFSGSIVSGRGDNGIFKKEALSFRLLALRCSLQSKQLLIYNTFYNLYLVWSMFFSGVGLRQTLKRKLEDAGVYIENSDHVVNRMASHVISSRAESTVTKYSYQASAFKEFCSTKGFVAMPAHSVHVAMYLSHLIDTGKSYNVISSAFYSIKWLHNINDQDDPTENSITKNMLECAKRLNSKPKQKKDVITSDHLIDLCSMYTDSTDPIDIRDLSMILLSYAGFLRFSEVSELRCNDIEFKADHILLHIRKSKTDIYREGKEVVIAKGISCACPYKMLQKYLECSKLSLNSNSFLFKPAFRSGSKCCLLDKDKKLSYTRAKECIVKKLKMVAPNLELGTHSLRASGATTAANAKGVSDRCLKRHGRWKSDEAKDGYIKDSLEKKLFITKQLQL